MNIYPVSFVSDQTMLLQEGVLLSYKSVFNFRTVTDLGATSSVEELNGLSNINNSGKTLL